jgi:hypothetical protein
MKLEDVPSIMTQYNNLYNGTLRKQKVLVKSWRLMGTSDDDRKKFTQRLCLALVEWKKATSNPHILPILGISGDEVGSALLSFVVPLCHNGNVNEYLSRNPTANALEIVSGLSAVTNVSQEKFFITDKWDCRWYSSSALFRPAARTWETSRSMCMSLWFASYINHAL